MGINKCMEYLKIVAHLILLCLHTVKVNCMTEELLLKHISEIDKSICYREVKCTDGNKKGLLVDDVKPDTISENVDMTNMRTSNNNETVDREQELFDNPCCVSECSCDVNTCVTEGTCCLDTLTSLPKINDVRSCVQMTCEYPQLRPYTEFLMSMKRMSNADNPMRMIRRCPGIYSGIPANDLITKCEHPEQFNNLNTKIPVVDKTTIYSYQNKFCALCCGVLETNMVPWDTRVECFMDSFYPSNWENLTMDIIKTSDCNLLYDAPKLDKMNDPKCQKSISKCNQTGKWSAYNETLERACLSHTREYIRSYERYKNVFCYLCNNGISNDVNISSTDNPDYSCLYERIMPEEWPGLVTFAAKLYLGQSYDRITTEVTKNGSNSHLKDTCAHHQIYDPVVDACRDVKCTFPKTLTRGRCTNMAEEYKGITYQACLEMSLLNRDLGEVDVHLDLSPLQDSVKRWLNSTLNDTLSGHWFFGISIKIPSGIENVEKLDLNYVAVKLSFKQTSMTSFSFLDEILSVDKTVFHIKLTENLTLNYHVKLAHWMCNAVNEDVITRSRSQGELTPALFDANEGPEYRASNFGNSIKEPVHLQQITKFNGCPHVVLVQIGQALKESEYGYYLDDYQKYVAFEDVLITNKFDLNTGSVTSLTICLDTLQQLFNMDLIDNVVTLPVSVPTVTYTYDVTSVATNDDGVSLRPRNGIRVMSDDRNVLLYTLCLVYLIMYLIW